MLDFLFTKTPLVYLVQNFWRDEAFTVLLARRPFVEILSLTARDFNPPLYYFLVNIWMRIFGSSEIAVRSLSILFYVGTVIAVFFIMEKVFNFSSKRTHIYLLIFLLNPLLLYNAFEARMYAMLAFFATLSWYFLKTEKRKLYILTTILGLYTHYFMVLVVASQTFYIASSHFLKKKKKLEDYKELGISILFFIPWILFAASRNQLIQNGFWILRPQFETYTHMGTLLYTGYELGFGFFKNFLWGLTILLNLIPLYGLYKLRVQKEKYRDIFLFVSSWFFIPVFVALAISLVKPIFLPRYLIASSVGLSLLLIYVLDELPKKLGITLMITLIFYSSFYVGLHIRNRAKAPVRPIIKEIRSLAKSNEPLYVVSELDFFTAQYYFDRDAVYIYAKDYDEIPTYAGKVLIPKDRIVHTLPFYPKKAFILNEDLSYSVQANY